MNYRKLCRAIIASFIFDIENKIELDELRKNFQNPEYLKLVAAWCDQAGLPYEDFMAYVQKRLW